MYIFTSYIFTSTKKSTGLNTSNGIYSSVDRKQKVLTGIDNTDIGTPRDIKCTLNQNKY